MNSAISSRIDIDDDDEDEDGRGIKKELRSDKLMKNSLQMAMQEDNSQWK